MCWILPRASLHCCTVPGSCTPCLGEGVPITYLHAQEKLGTSKPWVRHQRTPVMVVPGFGVVRMKGGNILIPSYCTLNPSRIESKPRDS